jgi:hypothetical protein
MRSGAGVGGRGASADCNGRGWVGWCAGLRRRGEHERWRRHVQGRLDLGQHGGGACAERESRVRARWYGMLRGAARPMDGAHGAAHTCCGEWCTVYGACGGGGGVSTPFESLAKGRPHRDAECCTATRARRALHDARALVIHRVARFPNGRMDASRHTVCRSHVAARCRPGACGTGCAGAVCDVQVALACVACCIGARCIGAIHRVVCCINMSHRCVLHRHALRVASVRFACCMFPRCVLHRCALRVASLRVACCIMHRRALRVATARVGVLHVAAARVARCILQTRSRPAADGRAVRCVVSAVHALLDRAKVLHVVTRYALYSARCGASAACFLLRVRRVVCDTLFADGVGRL